MGTASTTRSAAADEALCGLGAIWPPRSGASMALAVGHILLCNDSKASPHDACMNRLLWQQPPFFTFPVQRPCHAFTVAAESLPSDDEGKCWQVPAASHSTANTTRKARPPPGFVCHYIWCQPQGQPHCYLLANLIDTGCRNKHCAGEVRRLESRRPPSLPDASFPGRVSVHASGHRPYPAHRLCLISTLSVLPFTL